MEVTAPSIDRRAGRATWPRALVRSVIRGVLAAAVLVGCGAVVAAWIARGPLVQRIDLDREKVAVSALRLRDTVDALSERFRTRWITHPEVLGETADWIAERMRQAGLTVTEQAFTLREGTFRNVIGVRESADPEAPLLVLGAHYDAYGEMPGADDNASGIAGLLELVETLPGAPLRRTIHFVAFVNEEPPFFGGEDMGSLRYAQKLAEERRAVDLMVSLEMIGCFSDEPGSQRFPLGALRSIYPDRGNFIAVIGDLMSGDAIRAVKRSMLEVASIPVYSFRGPSWIAGVDGSDHRSFRSHGFPAVMVTDTAFLRNPNYHTRHDTADTLDYERMARVVQALHGVIRD